MLLQKILHEHNPFCGELSPKVLSRSRRRDELTVNIRGSHLRADPTCRGSRYSNLQLPSILLFSLEYATSAVRVTAAATGNHERGRKKLSLAGARVPIVGKRRFSRVSPDARVPRSPLTIRTEAKCRRRGPRRFESRTRTRTPFTPA